MKYNMGNEYKLGFNAALNGKTEKDCPYEDKEEERCDDFYSGKYSFNQRAAWMMGFMDGKEACPHCRGTGKKQELTKEERMRKGLFLHNLRADSKKPLR